MNNAEIPPPARTGALASICRIVGDRRLHLPFVAMTLILPAFIVFNYIYRFGVNVPYWDEWELPVLLRAHYGGTLTLGALLAQHNEHRIFLPRVVMLASSLTSNFDTRANMYVSWVAMTGAALCLFHEHVCTFGKSCRSWAMFLPAAWLVMTLRQRHNWLWGWQVQIAMVASAFVIATYFLQTHRGSWARFSAAVAAALCSTYSFSSGLTVWPIGLLHLWCLKRVHAGGPDRPSRAQLVAWTAAGIGAFVSYLWGYHLVSEHPSPTYFVRHLRDAQWFLRSTIGNSLFEEPATAAAAGVVLLLLVAVAVVLCARGHVDGERAVLAIPLGLFAAMNIVMILVGRAGFGPDAGVESRYVTLVLWGVLGLYRVGLAVRNSALGRPFVAAVVTLIALSIAQSLETEYRQGREVFASRSRMKETLLSYQTVTPSALSELYPAPDLVLERVHVLEDHHLSVFAHQTK